MNPEYRIEIGVPADVPHILALMEQYWNLEGIAGFDSTRMSRLLERVLSQPHLGTVWVARAGAELAGYLLAVFVFSLEFQGLIAEIDEFFVLPRARRHGIGTALLETAEARLAEAGCASIQLQLHAANAAARAFYRRRRYTARAAYELMGKALPGRADY
jgi:ribosomal protein S18 acetylase RimI-like enzyme